MTFTVKTASSSTNLPSAESNITTSYTPTAWTSGSVTVSATTATSYTIQYSTDLSTWTTGSSVSVSSNGNVYFRLYDGTNATTDYATCMISNIDTTKPTASISSLTSDTSSITWKVTGTDSASGIYTIAFYIGTSTSSYSLKYTQTCDTEKTSSYAYEYTFSGLTEGTTYYLKAIVTDYAGNSSTITKTQKTTSSSDTKSYDESDLDISHNTSGDFYISIYSVSVTENSITITFRSNCQFQVYLHFRRILRYLQRGNSSRGLFI